MQQRRFTKEFEEEAVRLVQTSGRTQREIAGDLGTPASEFKLSMTARIDCAMNCIATSVPLHHTGKDNARGSRGHSALLG